MEVSTLAGQSIGLDIPVIISMTFHVLDFNMVKFFENLSEPSPIFDVGDGFSSCVSPVASPLDRKPISEEFRNEFGVGVNAKELGPQFLRTKGCFEDSFEFGTIICLFTN